VEGDPGSLTGLVVAERELEFVLAGLRDTGSTGPDTRVVPGWSSRLWLGRCRRLVGHLGRSGHWARREPHALVRAVELCKGRHESGVLFGVG